MAGISSARRSSLEGNEMGTNFFATAQPDTFVNSTHQIIGTLTTDGNGHLQVEFPSDEAPAGLSETDDVLIVLVATALFPEAPSIGVLVGGALVAILDRPPAAPGETAFAIDVFDDNSVDYSFSPNPVFIDLTTNPQHGAPFAEGDTLTDIFKVTGTSHNDVIRGADEIGFTVNDPGQNVLNGMAGNDVLEGSSAAEVLNGGLDFDIASYESSPSAVTVRLQGAVADPQTAIATGGDAQGDTFSSIEGLVGGRFNDSLTGNNLNNVLAGG